MLVYKEKFTNSQGFTLLELMVIVAIAGIIMVVGIPSFNQSISNSRLTTNIHQLVSALNLARSEAVKRNSTVSVKKSGSEWESGWTVFSDFDGDGVQEAGDTLLRTYDALPNNYTLRGTYTNFITFKASGISASGSFVLCENSDSNNIPEATTSRVINISSVGRVGIGADIDNNEIPEIGNGTEITSCTVSPFT